MTDYRAAVAVTAGYAVVVSVMIVTSGDIELAAWASVLVHSVLGLAALGDLLRAS